MSIYLDSYANAVEQLGETYLTPAYAAAKENYFKVFEMCAAAHVLAVLKTTTSTKKPTSPRRLWTTSNGKSKSSAGSTTPATT